jgi:hypothetical protein
MSTPIQELSKNQTIAALDHAGMEIANSLMVAGGDQE